MSKPRSIFILLSQFDSAVLQASFPVQSTISKRHFTEYDKKKEYYGRKLVGFSKDNMYDVVSDVANYKKFVPFCKRSTIIHQNPRGVMAELQIGFPPILESYISNVSLVKPNMVRATSTDGRLFNYLETCWKFSPGIKSNPQSCIVDFSIDFEFKSKLHYQLASMFFDVLVKQMEGAFMLEAKKRYGNESIPTHNLSYIKS